MNLNPDAVAYFNSRGPIKNRRHKPDVVAPGTCIPSANSGMVQTPANLGPDNHWCYKEGTSMATPLVAGYAAVLRKVLTSRYPTCPPLFPSTALIKALLINGADILGPTASIFMPSNKSVHGRVNNVNAIAVVHGEPGTGFCEKNVIDPPTSQWLKKNRCQARVYHSQGKTCMVRPSRRENQEPSSSQGYGTLNCRRALLNKNNVMFSRVVWSPHLSHGGVTLKSECHHLEEA